MPSMACLYLVVSAFLVAHEVDAAFWAEWDMVGLRHGEPAFVLVHLPLAMAIIWGYGRIIARKRDGAWAAMAVAIAGLAVLVIHGAFWAGGDRKFATLTSAGVLIASAAAALPLAVLALRRILDQRSGS